MILMASWDAQVMRNSHACIVPDWKPKQKHSGSSSSWLIGIQRCCMCFLGSMLLSMNDGQNLKSKISKEKCSAQHTLSTDCLYKGMLTAYFMQYTNELG